MKKSIVLFLVLLIGINVGNISCLVYLSNQKSAAIQVVQVNEETNEVASDHEETKDKENNNYDVVKNYEVIVCGAEPEGIAAAVSAARAGLKTLLVDTRLYPGGLYTAGMLSILDMNYDSGSEAVPVMNQGLFVEMYKQIGSSGSIDIGETKSYFTNLLVNNGVDTLNGVKAIEVVKKNEREVSGIAFKYGDRRILVQAQYFIDAFVDAPVARQAGASYWLGREAWGLKEYACASLVFSVSGVDWKAVVKYLEGDHDFNTDANDYTAWGYSHLSNYVPTTEKTTYQLRGLNLSRQKNDTVVINAFQIFNVDSLSEDSKKEAYEKAKAELPYVVEHLRANATGFEAAQLDKVADELYLREGVRIIGEDTLTAEDCFNHTNFPNKIAYGCYPMDLQSARRDETGGNGLIGNNPYSIPMGVIISKDLDNVLVVGRSASYDIAAHSSARTVPIGIALGQAAGQLCQVAKEMDATFKTINCTSSLFSQVQEKLVSQGVSLNDKLPALPVEVDDWSYPYIQNLREQGVLAKQWRGRTSYGLGEAADYSSFGKIASLAVFHSNLPISVLGNYRSTATLPITNEKVVEMVNIMLNMNFTSFEELYEMGVIDERTYKKTVETPTLLNNHVYGIMSGVIDYLRQDVPLPSEEQLVHRDVVHES